jgi:putative phage-type endonuclease
MRKNLKVQQDIRKKKQYKYKRINISKMTSYSPVEILNELRNRPLIKQRTPEWFKLREDRLTASDLYDAIKNPQSLAKKKLKGVTFNSSGVPALKWGTMYEPMATRIYSTMVNKEIFEFGLVINEDIKHFGASPDGITEEGIMIEIKCPIKRKIIDGTIPDKYYYQIQGQLAVCKLKECDYVECEFIEFKSKDEYLENIKDLDESNQNFKHGIIAEIKVNNEYEYVYSSNNQKGEENLKEMKEFLINNNFKIIYWKLKLINVQKVNFNEEKWKNDIQDKINNFHEVYMIEKKLSNPINLFIKDDE